MPLDAEARAEVTALVSEVLAVHSARVLEIEANLQTLQDTVGRLEWSNHDIYDKIPALKADLHHLRELDFKGMADEMDDVKRQLKSQGLWEGPV